jgi:hypothetical protein
LQAAEPTLACKACSFRHSLTGILQAWRRSLVPRDIDLHGGRPSYGSLGPPSVCQCPVSHTRVCWFQMPKRKTRRSFSSSVRSFQTLVPAPRSRNFASAPAVVGRNWMMESADAEANRTERELCVLATACVLFCRIDRAALCRHHS